MRSGWWVLVLGSGLLAWGLDVDSSSARQGEQKENSEGTLVSIDGLQSRAPADWVEEKTNSQFRVKRFRLPGVADDKENAEVVIFYFGKGQGGSAEENIKRWKGLIVPPDDKKIDDVVKVEKMDINGVQATYLDAQGTYLFRARPRDAKATPKSNYRMIKVMFQSSKGPYYFSLIGPADTVAHYKKGFDKWLKAFK